MNNSMEQMTHKLDLCTHNLIKLYKMKFEAQFKKGVLKKITIIELGILDLLQSKPTISVKDAVEMLAAPNSTITSAVNRLEKRGILTRAIHPEDKRTFQLILSEEGEKVVKFRKALKNKMFQTVLSALDSHEERKTFLALLEKIYCNLL